MKKHFSELVCVKSQNKNFVKGDIYSAAGGNNGVSVISTDEKGSLYELLVMSYGDHLSDEHGTEFEVVE